eukprot:TRINITY_DN62851_c0_g1_i1.p1 TRINITY_DN62851_c0_g1~~TRINITY_DN62851_c0_g1_i1.p1  ORF type:complete len:343 (+),score=87.30 TRINITY_DN62851_c0_g1_i1:96-1124(+)
MLGRKPRKDGANARLVTAIVTVAASDAKLAASKKRKWQESEDEESDEKITIDDMEEWKASMREEEMQERMEMDRREREEREAARNRQAAEKQEQQRKEEENAQAVKEVEEARRVAEEAEADRRRQEDSQSGFAMSLDCPTVLPAGIAPGKEHLYKTSYCKRWEQGNCNFGTACHFAHGERELRGKPPKGSRPGTLSVALPLDVPRPQSSRGVGAVPGVEDWVVAAAAVGGVGGTHAVAPTTGVALGRAADAVAPGGIAVGSAWSYTSGSSCGDNSDDVRLVLPPKRATAMVFQPAGAPAVVPPTVAHTPAVVRPPAIVVPPPPPPRPPPPPAPGALPAAATW